MIDEAEKKTERIDVKVTPSFKNMLTVKYTAMNMKESEFVRSAIMNAQLNFKLSDKDIGTLIGTLGSIGNNINQIAHNLNIAKKKNALDEVDYQDIANQLLIIKEYMRNLTC